MSQIVYLKVKKRWFTQGNLDNSLLSPMQGVIFGYEYIRELEAENAKTLTIV
jgi:hypothetical protein